MSIGPFQLVIIALIVLLLFGRGRISRSLSEFGQGVKAFRKGLNDAEQPQTIAVEGRSPDPAHADAAIRADK